MFTVSTISLDFHNIHIYIHITLIPPISVTETKTSCDLLTIIKQTVSTLIDLDKLEAITNRNNYKFDSKFGLDGSGSHQIQQQSAENTDGREGTANYIG